MPRANLGLFVIVFLLCAQAVYAEGPQLIDATEAQAASAHGSVSASTPLSIPGKKPVELLSQKITLSDPKNAVLILVTVQLVYTAVPTNKTVELSVVRDQGVLETYSAEIGTAPRAVSAIPVSLHVWDGPGSGPHTYSVVATSSDRGVEARSRRLTVMEMP